MIRRKPPRDRKDKMLRIRVTADQKRLFSSAAAKSGLSVSSWLVERGIMAADAETPSP